MQPSIPSDLREDLLDPYLYDRDNGGEGTAERVVTHLKETGSVRRADGSSFADSEMSEAESVQFFIGRLDPGARKI